jgi:hypothetical protein
VALEIVEGCRYDQYELEQDAWEKIADLGIRRLIACNVPGKAGVLTCAPCRKALFRKLEEDGDYKYKIFIKARTWRHQTLSEWESMKPGLDSNGVLIYPKRDPSIKRQARLRRDMRIIAADSLTYDEKWAVSKGGLGAFVTIYEGALKAVNRPGSPVILQTIPSELLEEARIKRICRKL